jgi:hypothetical protein
MTAARWQFVWDPAGSGGPITFHAAVAVGFSTSFLQHACLRDATDAGVAGGSDMAGMDHGRRRLLGGRSGSSSGGGSGGGSLGSELRGFWGGTGGASARRLASTRDTDATPHAPVGTTYSACPAAGMAHAMGGGSMGESVFSATVVAPPSAAVPVLFEGAALTSRGRFAGAMLATFAFAAASSAAGAWAAGREAAAFGTPGAEAEAAAEAARRAGRSECAASAASAANAAAAAAALAGAGAGALAPLAQPPRFARAAGAAALVLRTGGHYGCMLISMTFNVWLLLALMGGHATAYLMAALAARRRARAAEAEAAEARARSVCG